jgi:hypothetical protein
MGPEMGRLLEVYRALASPERVVWRGGSWRLPATVAERHVVRPFLDVCGRHGVAARFCMQNLVETF